MLVVSMLPELSLLLILLDNFRDESRFTFVWSRVKSPSFFPVKQKGQMRDRFGQKKYMAVAATAMGFLVLAQAGFVHFQEEADSINAPLELEVTVIEVFTEAEGDALDAGKTSDLLLDAIVEVESGGNPFRVGRAGERGLMQIKRTTWHDVTKRLFGKPVSFDKAYAGNLNRHVGRAYLAELQRFLHEHRDEWHADERSLLLACYNAGPSRVKRAEFDLTRLPRSTQGYIERASALHDHYLGKWAPVVSRLLAAQRNNSRIG